MSPCYIVLADDHVRLRGEIKKILDEMPGFEVVAEVGEGGALFESLQKSRPDLVLLDNSMPNLRAMEATRKIKSNYPEVKVVIMVMDRDQEYVSHAFVPGPTASCLNKTLPLTSRLPSA